MLLNLTMLPESWHALVLLLFITLFFCYAFIAAFRRGRIYIKLEDESGRPPTREPSVDSDIEANYTTRSAPYTSSTPFKKQPPLPGHYAVKPSIPKFASVSSPSGKPAVRTHCSPLPALSSKSNSPVSKPKGDRMPGSNAYPLASIMFRTRGSELLEPDAADVGFGGSGTARSGVDEASTFRVSSARWRTPRETVDNRDYKAILSETRKRVDSKLSPSSQARRADLKTLHSARFDRPRREKSLPPRRDRGRRGSTFAPRLQGFATV